MKPTAVSLLLVTLLVQTAIGQSLHQPATQGPQSAGLLTTDLGGGNAAPVAPSNSDVLNKLDQLVEENAHLVEQNSHLAEQNTHVVEQNRELMEEIKALRQTLTTQNAGSLEPAEETEPGALLAAAATSASRHSPETNNAAVPTPSVNPEEEERKKKWGTYTPDLGFNVGETRFGDLNLKLFTYVRYLNQKALDPTYTNYFGTTRNIQQRQDIQVNKAIFYFLGWFMSPKFRYLGYVWSTNASQGLGAQVVVAGNLQYTFDRHFTFGTGINALPGTRSLEGNFPYWLGVDDRAIADEFFRPSYTTGIWGRGEIAKGLTYNVMLGNNMSQLGVSAAQLDNGLDTVSSALVWMPTTGEFGGGRFGDYEEHQKVATRIGFHFNRSNENKQSQPNTDSFDNVQIRLDDGTVIFTPNLFAPGTTVNDVTYHMIDADAGIKYRGFSFDGEYYHRWLNGFSGPGTTGLPEITDNGFQLQTSVMIRPKLLQLYATGSSIFGKYGNPWDARVGITYFPWRNQSVRWNAEYIQLYRSPVGASSLPYAVGGTGPTFNSNLMVNF